MKILKIKSIRKLDKKNDRYDLTINKNHNFFANGVCIHNTSGRTGYLKKYKHLNWFQKWWNSRMPVKFPEYSWEYVTGTRTTIIDPEKGDQGFYKNTTFREKIHEQFKKVFMNPGETIYYEIVGFTDTKKPIMAVHSVPDDELKKQFGTQMVYSYGCNAEDEEPWKVYVYRITQTTDSGKIIELPWNQMVSRAKDMGLNVVPELVKGFVYDGDKQKLWDLCEENSKGVSTLDVRHIREGVVVRIEDVGLTTHLKYKSAEFCLLEGIQKNDPKYVDTEETA